MAVIQSETGRRKREQILRRGQRRSMVTATAVYGTVVICEARYQLTVFRNPSSNDTIGA
jgi:hypothetical protein